jgi:hypothetical protein
MSEEKEPIDVVQVMYNALTKLEKQYVWVVMIKTPREDKIVVAFQEKEPTMVELAERDDVRDMFEYEYRHGHRDAQFSHMFVLAQESLKQVNDTRTIYDIQNAQFLPHTPSDYELMHDTLTRESEEYGWEGMPDNVYDFNAEELAMNDDYYNYLAKRKRRRA